MIVTVFDRITKEVICCIDIDDNGTGFCHENYEIRFQETEPVFTKIGGRIFFEDNKFIMRKEI